MSKYLSNPDIEAQVSSVGSEVGNAETATADVHKAAHTISENGRWKGNAADSIKAYANEGAVNLAGGMMELIELINAIGQGLIMDWDGYEGDASGKVEQSTVESLKEDAKSSQTTWDSLVGEMESTKSAGSAHTSMVDLETASVDEAYTSLFDSMDQVIEDLASTDSAALTDPSQLLSDIQAVKSQIESTMNYFYPGGQVPDGNTMISRVENLKNQAFYQELPNHSMWYYLTENPYVPKSGVHTSDFSNWNMGIVDGTLRTFDGYSPRFTKVTEDPLLHLVVTKDGWTIIDHKGGSQDWHLSLGSGEYAIIENPDGSRQKIDDSQLLSFYTNPTDPNATNQFSFSTELGGWQNNQFRSADGGYTSGTFHLRGANAAVDARATVFGVDLNANASGQALYANTNYRLGSTTSNENGESFSGFDLSGSAGVATAKGQAAASYGDLGVAISGDVDYMNASGAVAAYQEGDSATFGATAEINAKRARAQGGLQYNDYYVGMNNGLLRNAEVSSPGYNPVTGPTMSQYGPSNEIKSSTFASDSNKSMGGMFTIETMKDDQGNAHGYNLQTDIKSDTMKGSGFAEKEKSSYYFPSVNGLIN